MALDNTFSLGDDRFVFAFDPEDKMLSGPLDGLSALHGALAARGIETLSLTDAQSDKLSDFAEWLDLASTADIKKISDINTLFGDDLEITLVDDFRTTDGTKLNGAATADGQIFLDANLTGSALQDTLIEEISEVAYYKAFEVISPGDFGAEISARLSGEVDQDRLAEFQMSTQNDTVATAFGEAQAADISPARRVEMRDVFNPANSDIGVSGLVSLKTSNTGNTPVQEYYLDPVLDFNPRAINVTAWNGRYDNNNDGILDEYSLKAVREPADNRPSLYVVDVTAQNIVPTSQSSKVLIGKGEASTTWVLRQEQTHSTSDEFNWNGSVSTTLSASGKIFGLGVDASVSVETGIGTSITNTRSFTVANEVRETYKIPAGAYEEGTLVSYGFHMLTGNIDMIESFDVYVDITNARPGTDNSLRFEGTARGEIRDHYIGLVASDFDVTNVPNANEFLDIA